MRWSVTLSAAAADALATMDPPDRDAAFLVIGRLTQGPTPADGPRPRPYKAFPGDLLLPVSDRLWVGYRSPADHQLLVVDFVAGDANAGHYTLVELEDAAPTSVYRAEPATPYTTDRFNRGFAQIVDWFCYLDGQRSAPQFRAYWGEAPRFTGLLVIGRSAGLDAEGRHRLEWRSDQVRVNGRPVLSMTYDDFVARLTYALEITSDDDGE